MYIYYLAMDPEANVATGVKEYKKTFIIDVIG